MTGGIGVGGAARQIRLLLTKMSGNEAFFCLGCFNGVPEHLEQLRSQGIPVEVLQDPFDKLWPGRLLSNLKQVVRKYRIEIVHAVLPTFDILVPCLKFFVPRLRVITSRRNVDEYLTRKHILLLRLTNHLADAIAANSEVVAESVRRMEGFNSKKIHVIPNGVPRAPLVSPAERRSARQGLGLTNKAFVIAYLAHFRDCKGHRYIPALAQKLVSQDPNTIFLLAGKTEETPGYRRNAQAFFAQVRALGLENHIRYLGLSGDTRKILAASDVALNLSDVEGMSNSMMEAMAVGLPIVATRVGAARELVSHGKEGWLIPPGNYTLAVRYLLQMAQQPRLRREMGSVARERMVRDFSVEKMVHSYRLLYQKFLQSSR